MPTLVSDQIRIMLIDDHAIVRAGLRMLIENKEQMKVVGEAGNRKDALELTAREQADIILLDLDLQGQVSIDLIKQFRTLASDARIIVLTGLADPQLHRRAVQNGAMGLVLKEKAAEVLIKAIEKVHAGEVWLDRSMTASVITEFADSKGEPLPEKARLATLTEREREVITLVCQGLKNKQIGERLFISEATVRNHLTSILGKLELSDRFELALFSYRHGLGEPPR